MNIRAIRLATSLTALVVLCGAAPADTGRPRPDDPGSRPDRPAWVVDDVPDTVWILVEASAATGDEEEAREILRRAETLARRALEGHEDSVGRRFALAVVLGMRTDREGGRTKVDVAGELYEELAAVLALDPEHGRARHLMGRLHAGVRQMSGVTRWIAARLFGGDLLSEASWKEAERHLSFAEQRAPEVPDHHLQLALLYLETGRPDRAAAEARHVLGLEASSPLELAARAEAVKLLDELGAG